MFKVKVVPFICFLASILITTPRSQLIVRSQNNSSPLVTAASIENLTIRVKLHKGYADIEEDGYVSNHYTDQTVDTLKVYGELTLPRDAAVDGMFVWNGLDILKAKLKPMFLSSKLYDTTLNRSSSSPSQGKIMFYRLSDTSYYFSMHPCFRQTPDHVRIRYQLPFEAIQNDSSSRLIIRSALATGNPTNFVLNVEAKDMKLSVYTEDAVLKNQSVPFEMELPSTKNVFLEIPHQGGLLRTHVDSGEWAGQYLFLRRNVPQKLLKAANLRREIVCLWKWNFSEFFRDKKGNLSSEGKEAIAQAKMIQETMDSALATNSRTYFGLVHQPQANTSYVFPLGNYGSSGEERLSNYLSQINYDYIASNTPEYPEHIDVADSTTIVKIKKAHQLDFDSLLAKSVALYTPGDSVIRHLVVVMAGTSFKVETPSYKDLKEFPQLNDISVSLARKKSHNTWPGIDLKTIATKHAFDGTMNPSALPIPLEPKVTVSVQLKQNNSIKQFVLDSSHSQLVTAMHTYIANHTYTVSDSIDLIWNLFDKQGNPIDSQTESISFIQTESDTGIVKIIGAHPKFASDEYLANLAGPAFGVVRDGYALIAQESDTLSSALAKEYEQSGLPHLTSSEIFIPITTQNAFASDALEFFVQRLGPDRWEIRMEGLDSQQIQSIRIYDLNGQLIDNKNQQSLSSNNTFIWTGPQPGLYIIQVRTHQQVFRQKLLLQ